MNDRLGVGIGIKLMPLLIKFFTNFLIVIDLAVEDYPFCFVGITDGLFTACKVNDRQAPHRQANIFPHIKAVIIRPAMRDRRIHARECLSVYSSVSTIYEPSDSTHWKKSNCAW